MKPDHRTKLWRGRNGRLWRIADRLEDTAQAVRYARKPFDLVFPITNLADLTNQTRDLQMEWIEKELAHWVTDRGTFPRL